ncbi:hypothetical protein JCM10213_003368 [Rhodosporidiobolus nylandii]
MAGQGRAQDGDKGAMDETNTAAGPPTTMRELHGEGRRSEVDEGVQDDEQAQVGELTPANSRNTSPSSPPSLLSLPPELLDRIFELGEQSSSHLAVACLVCRAFVTPARRHLYKDCTILIVTEAEQTPEWAVIDPFFERKLETLLRYPHLAVLVRSLIVLTEWVDEHILEDEGEIGRWRDFLFPKGPARLRALLDHPGWSRNKYAVGALSSKSIDPDEYLEQVLRATTNLQRLDVNDEAEVFRGSAGAFPPVPLMHLTTLTVPLQPFDFGLIPRLRTLALNTWHFRPADLAPHDFPSPPPPALTCLRAYDFRAPFDARLEPFLRQLFSRPNPSLRTLHLPYPRQALDTTLTPHIRLSSVTSLGLKLDNMACRARSGPYVVLSALFPSLTSLTIQPFYASAELDHDIPLLDAAAAIVSQLPITLTTVTLPIRAFPPSVLFPLLADAASPQLRSIVFCRCRTVGGGISSWEHDKAAWSSADWARLAKRCEERGVELGLEKD